METGKKPMRLAVGLGQADQLEEYARAGADEVFFGYVPEKWMRRWGLLLPLNRRESRYVNAQVGGMNEVRLLRARARDLGVPLSVTLNALYYLPQQLPAVRELVLRLRDEGLDTLIIGDMGLLWYLEDRGALEGAHVHLSGEAGEVNRGMLPMLKKTGVERLIFHRKTCHQDRAGLVSFCRAHPECAMESFEAFAMNENCHFTGAYCACVHMDEWPPLCREAWRVSPLKAGEWTGHPPLPPGQGVSPEDTGCALCALYMLGEEGITHLKLVGRGGRTEKMAAKTALVKKAVRLACDAGSGEEYLRELRALVGKTGCGGSCYYPEWGFLRQGNKNPAGKDG